MYLSYFSHGSFKMNEWDSKCINDIFEYFLDTDIRYETILYDIHMTSSFPIHSHVFFKLPFLSPAQV